MTLQRALIATTLLLAPACRTAAPPAEAAPRTDAGAQADLDLQEEATGEEPLEPARAELTAQEQEQAHLMGDFVTLNGCDPGISSQLLRNMSRVEILLYSDTRRREGPPVIELYEVHFYLPAATDVRMLDPEKETAVELDHAGIYRTVFRYDLDADEMTLAFDPPPDPLPDTYPIPVDFAGTYDSTGRGRVLLRQSVRWGLDRFLVRFKGLRTSFFLADHQP